MLKLKKKITHFTSLATIFTDNPPIQPV